MKIIGHFPHAIGGIRMEVGREEGSRRERKREP